MGRPYHQPRYSREELAAKHNPNGRKSGKKSNKEVTKKVLFDRYLQERKELWEDIARNLEYERRYEAQKEEWDKLQKQCPRLRYWIPRAEWHWTERHWNKVLELESELIKRGA